MSRRDDRVRLLHMLDFARQAVQFCRGCTRADLDTDPKSALALARSLELIGEAARHVSARTRADTPAVPWREIIGTRDRLIHAYPEVNLDIVWEIVSKDLPRLIAELEKLLAAERE